eukprot:scaffold195647_cov32-Prasinocladus_malaysianus.AAC.1
MSTGQLRVYLGFGYAQKSNEITEKDVKNKAFELGVVELAAMPLQQLEAGDVSTIGTIDIQARLCSFARSRLTGKQQTNFVTHNNKTHKTVYETNTPHKMVYGMKLAASFLLLKCINRQPAIVFRWESKVTFVV